MTRKKTANRQSRIPRKPSWVADVENQRRWIEKFVAKLREVENIDATISAVLSNQWVLRQCATQVRLYSDPAVTAYFYQDRKWRGKRQVAGLNTAIKGVKAAAAIYAAAGNQSAENQLKWYEADLDAILQRSKDAFSNKRHGRDRDHTILVRLQRFLENHVGHTTYATLATLVNKAMEVDGYGRSETFTEETVRKNLSAFQKRNTSMMSLLAKEEDDARNQNAAK